jgi:glycyl-tRNA synthetase alpha subunit
MNNNQEVKVNIVIPNCTYKNARGLDRLGWEVEYDGKDINVFTTLDRVNTVYVAMNVVGINYQVKNVEIKLM